MAAGFVSSNIGSGTASTRTLTLTLTTGQAVAFGVIWESTATVSSVTSSLGNTYTLRGTEQTLGAAKIRVYTANNVSGGSETITVTFSASNYSVIWGMNVNGVDTAAFDGLGGPTSDTASPWTSSTVTPSMADAILVSFVINDSANVGTWTAGNSFTKAAEDGNGSTSWSVSSGYKVVSSTAADNASWTCSQGTNAIVYTLAFRGIPSTPYGRLIQSTEAISTSGTSASVTITGVTAGSTIIVQTGWDNTVAGLTGISDGVAYTSALYLDDPLNGAGASVRYRQGVAAGDYTITASFGASSSGIFMRAHEIGGIGVLNQVAGNVQTAPGIGTDLITSGASAATTVANCFIVGLSQNDAESPDGTGTLTAGTGYTMIDSVKHQAIEYKTVTSTGTQTATFTSTVNFARSTFVLAFAVAVTESSSKWLLLGVG